MANLELISKLRKETQASFLICKQAAEKYPDDYQKAKEYVELKMKEKGASKTQKATANGIIEVYSHKPSQNIGVMVEVRCQTDFVAMNEDFRKFAHEIALQIASMAPEYISEEDIPEEVKESTLKHMREDLDDSIKSKPEQVIENIIKGKYQKWVSQVCLLEQEYFRDPSKKVKDLLNEYVGKLGETIKIVRFIRWTLGQD